MSVFSLSTVPGVVWGPCSLCWVPTFDGCVEAVEKLLCVGQAASGGYSGRPYTGITENSCYILTDTSSSQTALIVDQSPQLKRRK